MPIAFNVESYHTAKIELAADTANQQLIAAPGANKQIWVYGLILLANTAAGTITIQDEDDTDHSGDIPLSDEGGFVAPISGNFAMPWIKVATNKALEADTATCSGAGMITYGIVSV